MIPPTERAWSPPITRDGETHVVYVRDIVGSTAEYGPTRIFVYNESVCWAGTILPPNYVLSDDHPEDAEVIRVCLEELWEWQHHVRDEFASVVRGSG